MGFIGLAGSLSHVRAGKLRPIAATGSNRSEIATSIPTFAELGFPEIDIVSWYGVLYPARTAPEIVARMSREVRRAMHDEDVKARLLQQGIEVVGTTPEQFAKFIRSEVARYGKIVKESGARLD
jgi:tripartite-type tricarboxylate transporter receptor subunit TctC